MVVFTCQVCQTSLSANESQAGQQVRCPTCMTVVRVPVGQSVPFAARAGDEDPPQAPAPRRPVPPSPERLAQLNTPLRAGGGARFGFNCGYCSSRLEATEAMSAQEGQCPTCGNQITIPIRDRYGRLIDPKTHEIIRQDPHPVHAYAAAGDRAPQILRAAGGKQAIVCPRCRAYSPITANNCKNCGMPFTMEGTTAEAAGVNNGWCIASLVLGIISMPCGWFIVPAILAIIFGIVGLSQISSTNVDRGGGRGMGIAGIVCGAIGLLLGVYFHS